MPRTTEPSGRTAWIAASSSAWLKPWQRGVEAGRRHVDQNQPTGAVASPELVHLEDADRAGGVVEDLQRVVGGHVVPFSDFGQERNAGAIQGPSMLAAVMSSPRGRGRPTWRAAS